MTPVTMPVLLLSATTAADTPDLTSWAIVAVIAFIAWRVGLIVLFPFAPCGHCKGGGKRRSGKFWRLCRWCKGTGRKIRLGRRVWDWVTGAREAAR